VSANLLPAFESELLSRRDNLSTILPRTVSPERFMATATEAIRNRPELLSCDRKSLFVAIQRAAEDGLMPDGREGVINFYNEKIPGKDGEKDRWIKKAAWVPMVFGIRKRALELANIVIDSDVIHQNDEVKWIKGDSPVFEVHPILSWKGKPGPMVAAFAVFRQTLPSGQIITLHREIMDAAAIQKVKAQSKNQGGLLWGTFEAEAWRKTAVRRGIKTVPSVPSELLRIVSRDDEQYQFDAPGKSAASLAMPPPIAPTLPAAPPAIPLVDTASPASAPMPPTMPAAANAADKEAAWLDSLNRTLGRASTVAALCAAWESNEATIEGKLSSDGKSRAYALYDKHEGRIQRSGEKVAKRKAEAA